MAIDFPASPTLNDVFTVGNVTYVWDGTKWTASVTGGISLDKIEEGNTSAEVIDTGSDGRFVVTTEGTERLRVTNTGLVGIGTSSPTVALEVNGGTNNEPIKVVSTDAGSYIAFADDTTTSPARLGVVGDLFKIDVNNSERLRIDSSGRLGIGTSSPGDALTVQGTGNSYIGLQSATSGYASLKQIVTDTSAWLRTETSHPLYLGTNQTRAITIDTSQRVGIGTATVNRELVLYKASAPAFHIQNSTSGTGVFDGFAFSSIGADATIWNYENGYLRFGTNDTERARIDSSGRLGIGTSSPSQLLHLSVSSGVNYIRTSNGTVDYYNGINSSNEIYIGSTTIHPITFRIGDSEKTRIDTSGRLLVGTSTAYTAYAGSNEAKYQQVGTSYQTATIQTAVFANTSAGGGLTLALSRNATSGSHTVVQNGDSLGGIRFMGSDGTNFETGAEISAFVDGTPGNDDMPTRLTFSTTPDGSRTPTERMRISANGDILAGSTSTWATAGSGASFYIHNNSDQQTLRVSTGDPGSAPYGLIGFYRNKGSLIARISTDGSTVSYNTSSDYRLKENVTPVSDGITRLQQLKPSRFNFIVDPDKTVDGFLAHEVQTIVPEAITGEKDAVDDDGNPVYQGIDQSKLVPLLTAALQEAVAKIETLEGMVAVNNITIDEQQHQLSTLAARLTALETP
jgi:hypothetical protein